jgi:hypothetical protein
MDSENVMIILNIIFSILFWKFAVEAFNNENDAKGWFDIFISALNTAVVANHFIY